MTVDIYKDNTRCGDKKSLQKMNEECKRFGELCYLKVNRGKEMSLVLAENASAFPWLMSMAVGMLFNDNPFAMYATIKTLTAKAMSDKINQGGKKE